MTSPRPAGEQDGEEAVEAQEPPHHAPRGQHAGAVLEQALHEARERAPTLLNHVVAVKQPCASAAQKQVT